MLKAIIIDDELKGRIALKQKLQDYCPEVQFCGEAANGEEGLLLIEKSHPEIVFLDIEMPMMNGFEMLQQLKNKDFHLVFTTAYDQYAIKAIKYAAFDYLLKPINIEELKTAVAKINNLPPIYTDKKMAVLEQNLHSKNSFNKIAIPTMNELLFFNVADI